MVSPVAVTDVSTDLPPYITQGNNYTLLGSGANVSAYGFQLFPVQQLFHFNDVSKSSDGNSVFVFNILPNFFCAGDFWDTSDEMYVIDYQNEDFAKVNLHTSEVTYIGHPNKESEADRWTGLTIDENGNAYVVSTDLTRTVLYKLDLQTGQVEIIGMTTDASVAIDIAAVGNKLYVVDIRNDALYELSTIDAHATYIGSIGYDANYAQGMDYDIKTKTLYLTTIEQVRENDTVTIQGQLRKADLETGNTTLIDLLPYAGEVDAFAIVKWQSIYLPMIERIR
jgi:DNA-binding beta-propeller fold protein YncE